MSFQKFLSIFEAQPKSSELASALATHPGDPLRVLAELLAVGTDNSSLIFQLVQHQKCGLEKQTRKGAYITASTIVMNDRLCIQHSHYSMVGSTPLILAAFADRADVVSGLLALGANARASTDSGMTALHLAAWRGNTSAIEALVNFGAKIDEQLLLYKPKFFCFGDLPCGKESPLHLAAAMNHVPAMEVLLSRGASTEVENIHHDTPLVSAITTKSDKAVALLAERGASCVSGEDVHRSPMHLAMCIVKGPSTIFDTLLSYGCPVNRRIGQLQDAPLLLGLTNNSAAAVRAMIAFGADTELPSKNQRSPLQSMEDMYPLALEEMHGVIQMLLDAGADISALWLTNSDSVNALLFTEGSRFV